MNLKIYFINPLNKSPDEVHITSVRAFIFLRYFAVKYYILKNYSKMRITAVTFDDYFA